MTIKIAFLSLLFGLVTGLGLAQVQAPKALDNPSTAYTPLLKKGLFDPSRFSMAHSYSVLFASNGKKSTVQNLYVNSTQYDLTKSLSVRLDLGYRFNPLANAKSNDKAILPNAELRFTPNEHFLIEMSYRTLDPYFYGSTRSLLDR